MKPEKEDRWRSSQNTLPRAPTPIFKSARGSWLNWLPISLPPLTSYFCM